MLKTLEAVLTKCWNTHC